MTLSNKLSQISTIFIDTAPFIYYIEAHPQFGPLVREVVNSFQTGKLLAFSSVMTLTEVLSKPREAGNEKLAERFADFLKHGKNLTLIEISERIAEGAARLKGRHPELRTIDAIQLSAAIEVGADAFVTNENKIKSINEIDVLVLKDYL